MELVGRAVRKSFLGFGTFSGVVESYDSSAGYFKIQYEDGDSEELDFEEIASILKEMGESPPMLQTRRSTRGRRPKKRRRGEANRACGRVLDGLGDTQMMDMGLGEGYDGNIAKDGILVEEGGNLKENGGLLLGNDYLGVIVEAQMNGNGFGGDMMEIASFRGLEETPQKVKLEGSTSFETSEVVKENAVLEDCKNSQMTGCDSFQGFCEHQGGESMLEKDEQGLKKRRKLSEKLDSTPEMPLRRSARRASTALLSPPSPAPCTETSSVNAVFDGKCSGVASEGSTLALPPSSSDFDVDGIPILDLFSVYTCLRSFSRLLFLSPFGLEAFVAALRCKFANSLIDSIHFSVLQALKRHLEFLSDGGDQSASDCLRNLNWGLIDLVTWPLFLVEYLLIHGSALRSGFILSHLKLLNGEYYKQPAGVKLEILRCLCDDVIEVEAIRSEINRRMLESERVVDASHNMFDRKRKESTMNGLGISSLTQEVFEETSDGNSDECCLCRMDGSLICCDGCPAAFHSRCVGVVKDLLPEGDWYCPECLMDNVDGLVKLSEPFRGAEFLGIDPHGRLYFGSCGYLLVSDSCDTVASYHYYNKYDLNAVIEVLKSSGASYSAIVTAISLHWGIPIDASHSCGHLGPEIHEVHEDLDTQVLSEPLPPSREDVDNENIIFEWTLKKNSASPENRGPKNFLLSDLSQLDLATSHQFMGMTCPFECSQPSNEIAHAATFIQMSQQTGTDCSMSCITPGEGVSLKCTDVAVVQEKSLGLPGWSCASMVTERRIGRASQLQSDPGGYINYYSFGRIASSVAEELIHKSSESNNKESKKSVEDVMSAQINAINKKSLNFSWYSFPKLYLDAQKENCGWCCSCKSLSDSDCLFKVTDDKHLEGSKNRTVGLRSEKNRRSHIVSAMHHILSVEDRLQGLLCGPWENPHYNKQWRKAVLKSSDVASLKHLLLTLESNLRRIALSAEWLKPVDISHTAGSASHVLTSSMPVPSKYGGSRKQAKKIISGNEFSFISHAATTSGIYWWRGGRFSRQVFHWKILPRLLASKGARQAGHKKIPSILYPEGSEFAKRSRYVAWRASVEMSESVAQLSYQLKDFDSNIRWNELANNELFPQLAKESRKLAKLFKKVTIRRKCIDETSVKYLLDFGKRQNIPGTVARHGIMLEESSSGRKKYWLNESHVPLNLLKAFEEKRLVRLLKKKDSGLISEKGNKYQMIKPKRSKGLSHLLSREQKSAKQLCPHCNKDVLIREAVNCQFCDGYFHRRHFRVPKGAITATYTCYKCKDKRSRKKRNDGIKVKSKRRKISTGKQSQEVLKKRKNAVQKSKKKLCTLKRGTQIHSKTGRSKNSKNGVIWCKRQRTVVHHSYWLNGLQWSRKPDDERATHFGERKVLLPSQHLEDRYMQPVCCICHEEYNSGVIYIGCETCEDWFHGDVFGLTVESINNLIGFKCHKCRMRSIPVCPFSKSTVVSEVHLHKECFVGAGTMVVKDLNDAEKLHCAANDGTVFLQNENCPAKVYSKEYLHKERKEDAIPHLEEDLLLSNKTISIDEPLIVESLEHAEAKDISFKHEENGIQIEVASVKMDDDFKEMMDVPELLVVGTLGDSTELHRQTIVSTPQLLDI